MRPVGVLANAKYCICCAITLRCELCTDCYLRQRSVCLSVCLLARLLKNACMNLDEMLRVDMDVDEIINF